MTGLQGILFLAKHDLKIILKERNTKLWVFFMPIVFFVFIGSATGGRGPFPSESAVPLLVENNDPGFLSAHLETRLQENLFEVSDYASAPKQTEDGKEILYRVLTIPADFTAKALNGEKVTVSYQGRATGLSNDYDFIRIQKAVLTTVADLAVVKGAGEEITHESLAEVSAIENLTTLEVSAAGKRATVPSGFEQAIPGTLVMFTLLVLLTSGAISLLQDREKMLLRRLASAPYSRGQVVTGKWLARMGLAVVQVAVAIGISFIPYFDMTWGPNLPVVILVLIAWGGFCTSLSILLGSLGKSEGQVTGYGVLSSMILAALGGCWWPIEIAPDWMQSLQMFLPTGWVMDALHKLISFGQGPDAIVANMAALILGTIFIGWVAAKRFRFA